MYISVSFRWECQCKSLTAFWTFFMCSVRFLLDWRILSHSSHLCGFKAISCFFARCWSRYPLLLNPTPQILHWQDWVAFMSQPYWVEIEIEAEVDLRLSLKWGWGWVKLGWSCVEVEVRAKMGLHRVRVMVQNHF